MSRDLLLCRHRVQLLNAAILLAGAGFSALLGVCGNSSI
jgi:hypothetical protein